jgi:hypothetical protein
VVGAQGMAVDRNTHQIYWPPLASISISPRSCAPAPRVFRRSFKRG